MRKIFQIVMLLAAVAIAVIGVKPELLLGEVIADPDCTNGNGGAASCPGIDPPCEQSPQPQPDIEEIDEWKVGTPLQPNGIEIIGPKVVCVSEGGTYGFERDGVAISPSYAHGVTDMDKHETGDIITSWIWNESQCQYEEDEVDNTEEVDEPDVVSHEWSLQGSGEIEVDQWGNGVFTAPESGTTVTIKATFSDAAVIPEPGTGDRDDSDVNETFQVKVVEATSLQPGSGSQFCTIFTGPDDDSNGTPDISTKVYAVAMAAPGSGGGGGPPTVTITADSTPSATAEELAEAPCWTLRAIYSNVNGEDFGDVPNAVEDKKTVKLPTDQQRIFMVIATAGSSQVRILVAVVGVDLGAVGVFRDPVTQGPLPEESQPTPHEEDPGAFFIASLNFDAQTPSLSEHHRLHFSATPFSHDSCQTAELTVSIAEGSDRARMWRKEDDGQGGVTWHNITSYSWNPFDPEMPEPMLYVEGYDFSEDAHDVTIRAEYKLGSLTVEDEVLATVIGADIDIDSDNNNNFSDPARTPAEDKIEVDPELSGKELVENSDDNDNDGILDWVDWENEDEEFVPVVIEKATFGIDTGDEAKITIGYSTSNPTEDAANGEPVPDPFTGRRRAMRLWKKAGAETRDPLSAGSGGDYVAPGEEYAWSDLADGESGEIKLYAEGIGESVSEIWVSVTASAPWSGGQGTLNIGSDAVKVTVLPRPRVYPDGYSVVHDTSAYFGGPRSILANDSITFSINSSDGELKRTVILFKDGEDGEMNGLTEEGGEVQLDATGGFIYTPKQDWYGTDTFQYKAAYGEIFSAPVTVTIEVTNSSPVAAPNSYSVVHGRDLVIDAAQGVLSNDSDVEDSAVLEASVEDGPSHGTLELHSSGAFSYTPNDASYTGQDSFTYKVIDGVKDSEDVETSDTATVTIWVTNTLPSGQPDSYRISFGSKKIWISADNGVLSNDGDGDSDRIKATIVDSPSHGTVSLKEIGAFTYTMDESFEGTDQFTYKINDGAQDSSPIQVYIEYHFDTSFELADDEYTVTHGRVLTTGLEGTVVGNDSIPGDASKFTVQAINAPVGLSFQEDGSFTYEAGDTLGPVTFSYEVHLDNGPTEQAEVTINVINNKPSVIDATYNAVAGRALIVRREQGLGGSAGDSDGDFMTLSSSDGGPGSLTVHESGAFTYMPPSETYNGVAEFTYKANDGVEDSESATLRINVSGTNAPPMVSSRLYDVDARDRLIVPRWDGLLSRASDTEGDPLDVVVTNSGEIQGTLTSRPGGSFSYTPPANLTGTGDLTYEESVQFKVVDLLGESEAATVTFRVHNKAPVAAVDSYEVTPGKRLVVSQRSGLIANDKDEDGDLVSAELMTQPSQGELTFFSESGAFVYVPDSGMSGTDSFTYRPTDGLRIGQSVTVTLTLGEAGPAPTANNDTYTIFCKNTSRQPLGNGRLGQIAAPDAKASIGGLLIVSPWKGVLSNDKDPNGQLLTAELVAGPSHGTLEAFDTTGSFVYEPANGYVGDDSFSYRVTKGELTSGVATVTIAVQNTTPATKPDQYRVKPDTTLVTSIRNGVTANDRDAEWDMLTTEVVAQPANGTLVFHNNGSFAYTPVGGWTGTDSFTYRASDGLANSSTETVTIIVSSDPEDVTSGLVAHYRLDEAAGATTAADESGLGHHATAYATTTFTPESGKLGGSVSVTGSWGRLEVPDNATLSITGALTLAAWIKPTGFGAAVRGIVVKSYGAVNKRSYELSTTTAGKLRLALSPNGVTELTFDSTAAFSAGQWTHVAATYIPSSGGSSGEVRLFINGNLVDTFTTGVPSSLHNNNAPLWVGRAWNPSGNSYRFSGQIDEARVYSRALTANQVAALILSVPTDNGPTGASDQYTLTHDTTLHVPAGGRGVLANDYTFNDGILQAELVDDVSHGTLALNVAGGFSYTPTENYVGQDSFTYKVRDAFGESDAITVTLAIENSAPIAENQSHQIHIGDELQIALAEGLSLAAEDVDADELTATLVNGVNPAHGTLTLRADGSYDFVPAASFVGTANFTYTLSDGVATSDPATVTIEVLNEQPVVVNEEYSVTHDGVLLIAADDGFLANDKDDDGDYLTPTVSSLEGLQAWATGAFTYQPPAGFVGDKTFTYTLSDGVATSQTATVTIHVTNTPPPSPVGGSFDVRHDRKLVVQADQGLFRDAKDVDGDRLAITNITNPQNGSVTIHDDGSFIYTPNSGLDFSNGPVNDSFACSLTDGIDISQSAQVNVSIQYSAVSASNDPVDVVGRQSYRTSIDKPLIVYAANGVLRNDSNPEERSLEVTADEPTNGEVDLKSNGAFVYTPDDNYSGSDSFTYTISDGISESTATVLLEIAPSGLVAQDDAFSVAADWILVVTPDDASTERWPDKTSVVHGSLAGVPGVPTGHDSIPENSSPTFVRVSGPSHGTLTLGTHGGFVYRPTMGYSSPENEPDTFTYKIVTTQGESNVATVRLTIGAGQPLDLAGAPNEITATRDGAAATVDIETTTLLQNLNPNYNSGYPVTVEVTQPAKGQVYVASPGALMYQADGDVADGTYPFTYKLKLRDITVEKTVNAKVISSAPSAHDFLPNDLNAHIAISVVKDEEFTSDFYLPDIVNDADFDWRDDRPQELMIDGVVVSDGLGVHASVEYDGTISFNTPADCEDGIFHIQLKDSKGNGGILAVRVVCHKKNPTFAVDTRNGEERAMPPYEDDEFAADAGNEVMMALIDSFKATRDLEYAEAQARIVRQAAAYEAGKTQYDAAATAATTRNDEIFPKLQTLATAILDADQTRISAEATAAVTAVQAEIDAELAAWTTIAGASDTYDSAITGFAGDHQEAVEDAQVTQVGVVSDANESFETTSVNERAQLLAALKQAAVIAATERATSEASYRNTLDVLEASLKTDLQTQATTRDNALTAARTTLQSARNQVQTDLSTTVTAAVSAYETAIGNAVTTRDTDLAQVQSDYHAVVAAAQAVYAGGTQDQNVTAPLNLGNIATYLSAVAAAKSDYDDEVNAAADDYESTLATATQALRTALGNARAAANTALATADAAYRTNVENAEATYEQAVDTALATYDTAVIGARNQLVSSLESANGTYSSSVSTADGSFDSQMQSAIQAHYDASKAAMTAYDDALISAMEDYEDQLSGPDSTYKADLLDHRNAYDVAQADANADFRQARLNADIARITATDAAEDEAQSSLFSHANQLNQQEASVLTSFDTATRNVARLQAQAVMATESDFRDAEIDATKTLKDSYQDASREYALSVQGEQEILANALEFSFLDHTRLISDYWNPFNGWVHEDKGKAAKKAIDAIVIATATRNAAEAAADKVAVETLGSARIIQGQARRDTQIAYDEAMATAATAYVDATTDASKAYIHAKIDAEIDYYTTVVDEEETWGTAIATAAANWRKALGESQKTYLTDSAQAVYDYAMAHAQANTDLASGEAEAGEELATALSDAGVTLNTATSDIMTAWRTSHDTAATQLMVDRATAMTTFSTALQIAESGLDNAVMTAAASLFVNMSSAAETRANMYAEGLETYSAAVTGAFTTFAGVMLPAVEDYDDAERTALESWIDEVHVQRVAAVDAWRVAQGTNWATFVDAVADADQAYAEDAADAQTASIGSVSTSGVTYHDSFVEAEADAATAMAAASRVFTTDATSASTAFEQAVKQNLLAMTEDHNAARSVYLIELAQQNADAESDAAEAMSDYNTDVSAAQATLQTTVAEEADALTTAIAAADRTQLEESAEALQAYRETDASAVKTRDTDIGTTMKTLGDSEADAATTHATSIYGAWHTQRTESLELDRTYQTDLSTASAEFDKVVRPARLIEDGLQAGYDPTEGGDLRTARSELYVKRAEADKRAAAAQPDAVAARTAHWEDQVSGSNGMASLKIEHAQYQAFHSIGSAMTTAVDRVEGFVKGVPVLGNAYSATQHFLQGNILKGTGYLALTVSDYFLFRSIISGIAKGSWRAFKFRGPWVWEGPPTFPGGVFTRIGVRPWLGDIGYAKPFQQIHHWAFQQNRGLFFKWIPDFIRVRVMHQPWNFMRVSNATHELLNALAISTKGNRVWRELQMFWYGTPTWFKAWQISINGRAVRDVWNYLNDEY